MARFQSAYVTVYLPITLIMSLHALYGLFTDSWAWLGVLFSAGTILGFFMWLMRPEVGRTSTHLAGFTGAVVTGTTIAWIGYLTTGSAIMAIIYSSVNLVYWLGYVYWYSLLNRGENNQLQVGRSLPHFTLEDADGKPVQSHMLNGRPALIMFYRGNWCPLCMTQIKEIAAQYRELDKRGVQVVLISPQPHKQTQELAETFDVPFHYWVDADGRVAKQLNLYHESGVPLGMSDYGPDTVFPTALIIDAEGKILFADLTDNYRIRPEPQTFLRVLDGQPAVAA